MGRKAIHELLNIALDIIEKGQGENGYPYVYMSVSNYGTELRIEIMDDGFNFNSRPCGRGFCKKHQFFYRSFAVFYSINIFSQN